MSFNTDPTPPIYTYNRGMTLIPEQQYAQNVAYYMPRPGGQARPNNASAGGGMGGLPSLGLDFSQFFGTSGGTAGAQTKEQRVAAKMAERNAKRMGNSPFRNRTGLAPVGYQPGGGQWNQGSAAPPPATTNPQVPIGGGGGGGQTVNGGITSGQLSSDSIQKSLQALLKGGLKPMSVSSNMSMGPGGSISGGLFGDLMRSNTMRSSNEFSRAASQQQADMQHAFEVARANADLQQMQLLSDTNRENVTNQVTQRNTILDLLGQLLRGFGGV